MRRSSSGISPVVATVILVAIAIVIAIAVAFWASGLVGIFTRFEKLEITAVYATPTGGAANQYDITIRAKNTGSSRATVDEIHLNGVPICGSSGATGNTPPGITSVDTCPTNLPDTLDPGEIGEYTVTVTANSPGISVEVAVHTASGKMYPYSVLLP